MNKYLLLASFWIAIFSQSFAYHLIISGSARGLNAREVRLGCSAWVEEQVAVLNESGRFAFAIDNPYPAMYELRYGTGLSTLKTELFAFEDLVVEADLVSVNGSEQIFLKVPSYRCTAFKTAKNYTNDLLIYKNTSAIDAIVSKIKNTPNIQMEDVFTDVFARAEMLNFVRILQKDYGIQVEKPAFKREEFQNLPLNSDEYLGFSAYKELMVAYNQNRVTDAIIARQKSIYDFATLMHFTDSMAAALPEPIRFDMTISILNRFRFKDLPPQQGDLYMTKLKALVNQYPNHPAITELELKMVDIFNSLVNRPAPYFFLTDMYGGKLKLEDLKNTFVLLDVWGSWCKPCRMKSGELRDLHKTIVDYGMEVELIGVANEEDKSMWKEAIAADGMTWKQLLADREFLANYQISEYPTMILIDKQGKIRKVSNNITLNDLIEIIYK